MTDKHKQKSYKDKNGTTRVGDALRWLKNSGVKIAPELLDLAGTITGRQGLSNLADKIRDDENISEVDKQYLLEQIELDKLEMIEISNRWKYDMQGNYWLPSNIRPLALAFLTLSLFLFVILDSSIEGFKVAKDWIILISKLLLLVYGAYFGARTLEKIAKTWNK